MSYRQRDQDLTDILESIEQRLRRVEQPGSLPPSRDWVLVELSDTTGVVTLHWKNALTGAVGPAIGSTA